MLLDTLSPLFTVISIVIDRVSTTQYSYFIINELDNCITYCIHDNTSSHSNYFSTRNVQLYGYGSNQPAKKTNNFIFTYNINKNTLYPIMCMCALKHSIKAAADYFKAYTDDILHTV